MSNEERPETPEAPGTPADSAPGSPAPASPAQPTFPAPPAAAPAAPPTAPGFPEQPTVQFPPASQPAAPAPEAFPSAPPAPQAYAAQAGGPGQPGYPAQPGYPTQPGYPAQPGQPGQQAPMNSLAIVAFVGSFFVSLVGIICGHIAMKQTKRDGTRGYGFALAGTIIGYVSLAATIIAIIFSVVLIGIAATATNNSLSELNSSIEELDDSSVGPDSSTSDEPQSEFCALVDDIGTNISVDPNDTDATKKLADTYRQLAAVAPGETGAVYERFAEFLDNPAGADQSTLDGLMTDLSDALTEDFMACY